MFVYQAHKRDIQHAGYWVCYIFSPNMHHNDLTWWYKGLHLSILDVTERALRYNAKFDKHNCNIWFVSFSFLFRERQKGVSLLCGTSSSGSKEKMTMLKTVCGSHQPRLPVYLNLSAKDVPFHFSKFNEVRKGKTRNVYFCTIEVPDSIL